MILNVLDLVLCLDIDDDDNDDDNNGDDNIGSRSVHPWLAVKCEIDTLSALSTDPMLIIVIITRIATTLSPLCTVSTQHHHWQLH